MALLFLMFTAFRRLRTVARRVSGSLRQRGGATRSVVAALAVSAAALVGIANREAFVGKAYRDGAGIPTIGYGETAGVHMGDTTTPARALVQLLQSASAHADGIKRCIHVPLYQYEFDAYVDLVYNIGVPAFCRTRKQPDDQPTFIEVLNAGDYVETCKRILRFNTLRRCPTCPREVSRGLTLRREANYRTCIGESPA
jgi:lysozyme